MLIFSGVLQLTISKQASSLSRVGKCIIPISFFLAGYLVASFLGSLDNRSRVDFGNLDNSQEQFIYNYLQHGASHRGPQFGVALQYLYSSPGSSQLSRLDVLKLVGEPDIQHSNILVYKFYDEHDNQQSCALEFSSDDRLVAAQVSTAPDLPDYMSPSEGGKREVERNETRKEGAQEKRGVQ